MFIYIHKASLLPTSTMTRLRIVCLLERLKTAIRAKRKGLLTQGVILLHDNARPHTARLTLETVKHLGLEVLPHPPYSPNVAPSDYHLFGPMKKNEENARWAEIRVRYRCAISRSSVAWTAASTVLCVGHSEAC